jgi:hypothetical protein
MRKITKRSAAVIGATVVAIGGGAAWAATAWFEGTGSASAASSTIQTVTATAAVSDKLYPGKNATAVVTVTNPNDYPVRITGATLTDVTVANANGCTANNADLKLGTVPNNVVIAAKPANVANATPTAAGSWAEFVRMGAAADPKCSGASFTVTFTLQGAVA